MKISIVKTNLILKCTEAYYGSTTIFFQFFFQVNNLL